MVITSSACNKISNILSAPNDKMAEVLKKTVKEAKDMISKVRTMFHNCCDVLVRLKFTFQLFWGKQIKNVMSLLFSQKKVQANEFVTLAVVQEAINILRGAVTIVYPMGLPPHDPIRCEFENVEDLSGTQVSSLQCKFANLILAR